MRRAFCPRLRTKNSHSLGVVLCCVHLVISASITEDYSFYVLTSGGFMSKSPLPLFLLLPLTETQTKLYL